MNFGARIIEVIHTNNERRGKGIVGDPIRVVDQYWKKDGTLLFEKDPDRNPYKIIKQVEYILCCGDYDDKTKLDNIRSIFFNE